MLVLIWCGKAFRIVRLKNSVTTFCLYYSYLLFCIQTEKRLLGIPLLSARLFSSASKNPKALPASVVVKETKDRSSPWGNGSPLFRRSARRLNTPVLQDRVGTKVEKEIINAKVSRVDFPIICNSTQNF